MENEDIHPRKGLVICDRDTCAGVPPFAVGTTGERAFQRSRSLGLLNARLGWSDISPLFGFLSTWGRTLENYVGPHVTNLFFSENRRPELTTFTNAFPHFPRLTNYEWDIWRMVNLKDGTRTWTPVAQWLRSVHGTPPAETLPRLRHYSQIRLPGDVIQWVIENAAGTQHSRRLQAAIKSDLTNGPYNDAIREVAVLLREVAAGDRSGVTL